MSAATNEIAGPSRFPSAEYLTWVSDKSIALAEPMTASKERQDRITMISGNNPLYVPQELKLDAAPGINRVPLTLKRKFEIETEVCRLLGKDHPDAENYDEFLSSDEYAKIEMQEEIWRQLGILQRGL